MPRVMAITTDFGFRFHRLDRRPHGANWIICRFVDSANFARKNFS